MMAALGVKRIFPPIEAPDLKDGPVYVGWRHSHERPVYVVSLNCQGESVARPLTHHVKHSPDGFEWGYGGSGPADLAYAILRDYLDQNAGRPMSRARWHETMDDTAWALHQEFKGAFVAYFPAGHWHLSAASVEAFCREAHEDPRTPVETRIALGYLLRGRDGVRH